MLSNLGGKIKTPLQCLEHNVWFTESQIKREGRADGWGLRLAKEKLYRDRN